MQIQLSNFKHKYRVTSINNDIDLTFDTLDELAVFLNTNQEKIKLILINFNLFIQHNCVYPHINKNKIVEYQKQLIEELYKNNYSSIRTVFHRVNSYYISTTFLLEAELVKIIKKYQKKILIKDFYEKLKDNHLIITEHNIIIVVEEKVFCLNLSLYSPNKLVKIIDEYLYSICLNGKLHLLNDGKGTETLDFIKNSFNEVLYEV